MKKSTKKLQLNKESSCIIRHEAMAHVKGGVLQFWTTGCTDGCGLPSSKQPADAPNKVAATIVEQTKSASHTPQRCGTRNCPNPTDINTEIECLLENNEQHYDKHLTKFWA